MIGTIRPLVGLVRERFDLKRFDFELPRHLSRLSVAKYFDLSIGQHRADNSHIKRSVVSKGESSIVSIVNIAIYDIAPITLGIVIPIFMLLINATIVGICAIVVIISFTYYSVWYSKRAIPKIRRLDSESNRIGKRQAEILDHVDVVLTNAQELRAAQEFDAENRTKSHSGQKVWVPYVNAFYGGQIMIVVATVLCTILCAYLAFIGRISAEMFITTTAWVATSIGTLSSISGIQRNVAKYTAPVEKFFRFLDHETDIVIPDRPIEIGRIRGCIEFRSVCFAYQCRSKVDRLNLDNPEELASDDSGDSGDELQDFPALRNVSFKLEAGKRYAFVGESGAGKSTIVNLLMRGSDPQNGAVFIDGHNLKQLDYRAVRRQIGLVPQEVVLFDGTMQENVCFGLNGEARSVTPEQLEAVARQSRITGFWDKLERGWDTLVGERGIKLSGGQRQRIGIARALIKNPPILVFDEATSSLDTVNEGLIREGIEEATRGRTTIIIAHRLATIKEVDEILVFNDGELVGQGTHSELFQSNTHYQRLVKNQVSVQ